MSCKSCWQAARMRQILALRAAQQEQQRKQHEMELQKAYVANQIALQKAEDTSKKPEEV